LPKVMRSEDLGPDRSRRPLYPMFRDEDELLPGQDLPDRIRRGLEQSQFLIVVCSPRAARSEWVEKEIVDFAKLGRSANILSIIVEGTPNAPEGSPTEALPRALRFHITVDGKVTDEHTEALWIDFRKGVTDLRLMFLRVVAALLGLESLDE